MISELLILASRHWGNCHLRLLRPNPNCHHETNFEVRSFVRLPFALASSFTSTAFVAFIMWASLTPLHCSRHSWPSSATVTVRVAFTIASCSFAFGWHLCSYPPLEPLVKSEVRLRLMGSEAAAWATHRAKWQLASTPPYYQTVQIVNRQRCCGQHDLYPQTHSNCAWSYHRKSGPSQPSCSFLYYLNCYYEQSFVDLAMRIVNFELKMLCFINESTFVCLSLCLSLKDPLGSLQHHLQHFSVRRSY